VTTRTSKADLVDGTVKATVSVLPVPAPRPRVRVHNGVGFAYYAGKYKTFLAEAPKAIPESPIFYVKGTPLIVNVTVVLPRPMKPANEYPVGDVDNYAKSVLDAVTKNGSYWHDDVQITTLVIEKRYTDPHEAPYFELHVRPSQCES
jgi:Holliday junction resolvase RusA-like endonuclease